MERYFHVNVLDNDDGTRTVKVAEDVEGCSLDKLQDWICSSPTYTAVEKKNLMLQVEDLKEAVHP